MKSNVLNLNSPHLGNVKSKAAADGRLLLQKHYRHKSLARITSTLKLVVTPRPPERIYTAHITYIGEIVPALNGKTLKLISYE
ncbi:kinesin light chain 3 [Pyrus ussuriensis x Pyrus communis]|uniref:Kinesin light chain 3 n=1 Tax=Pyrus ussuriensis x Pyrus communis TaxID=2448454 RepID=A0A5N5GDP9_9ROSA|nr:kinesin light chain 3 [Pyrus ussuriensis x Pyrus communis]